MKEPWDPGLRVTPLPEKVSDASWLMWLNILKKPPPEVCWPSLSVVDAVCLPHFWDCVLPIQTVSPFGSTSRSSTYVLPDDPAYEAELAEISRGCLCGSS